MVWRIPPFRIVFWVATCAMFGLLFYVAWSSAAPPLEWLLLLLLAYVGIAILGVLVPQLQMFGDVACEIAPSREQVALTFDDGPHPRTTRAVLELLGSRGQHATFFVIGAKMERYPDVIREIHAAGHAIGLHSYNHERLYSFKSPRAVARDIERGQQLLQEIVGYRTAWFRPPIGHVSPRTASGARRAGVSIVAWSIRGVDGLASATPQQVVLRVRRKLTAGAIVLLHDAAERDDFMPASLDALPEILDELDSRGLRSVSLSDLSHAQLGLPAEPGLNEPTSASTTTP